LKPLKKYSLIVSRWGAHAADGRVLKSYDGMFGSFTTDEDPTPKISSTSPKNGDTNVSRSGPFTIRFDRPMDPTSLKSNLSIEVADIANGAKVSIDSVSLESEFSVVWSEENALLSLVPRKTLKANHSYLIRLLKSALKSKTGRSVDSLDNLWGQFTTGEL